MNCVVTAGPTFETLDNVRRLTNFSTGRLGTELANFLTTRGHTVTLLLGEPSTYSGTRNVKQLERFTTTADLTEKLHTLARQNIGAVFHAAAVSDFRFGKIWGRLPNGELSEIKSGKLATRSGPLLAELVPTPKIIAGLRSWYPQARLVGWKFEVDGDPARVLQAAEQQLLDCQTDACVANGPAYGAGFGLVTGRGRCAPLAGPAELFTALAALLPVT
ncbi:MAG: phosphopantothenoylcysteine decarboxylase [Verrucomicrobiota bacterium]|nr:DNA/pantothenate metabolism flavoprotein domain protein [Verrucomicrobiota bacterium]MCC6819900.1 DNA/pantothenate metabolism flavoprotein domain protein [Limisphaerales bacterium]